MFGPIYSMLLTLVEHSSPEKLFAPICFILDFLLFANIYYPTPTYFLLFI